MARVKVYGTGIGNMKLNNEYIIGEELATKMVANGFASYVELGKIEQSSTEVKQKIKKVKQ